jgi:hypothetical protein
VTNKARTKKAAFLRKNPLAQVHSDFGRPTEVDALISFRAYQLYSARGCEPGHDLEDWLRAEEEVMQKRIHTLEM